MGGLVLSRDEVRDLTRSHTRAGQSKFLRTNGVRHYLDGHGWPVVLRSAVDPTNAAPADGKAWKSNKAA